MLDKYGGQPSRLPLNGKSDRTRNSGSFKESKFEQVRHFAINFHTSIPQFGVTMTHEDYGHYAQKHSPKTKINPAVADAVKARSSNGEIPCAVAFDIAGEAKVSPKEVGLAIDTLETKVTKCQLGLFGHGAQKIVVRPAHRVPPAFEDAIQQSLVQGKLPCKAAWDLAEKFGLRKMEVSAACEALKVKISSCQLGTFP
jgi:hypothetical protein